MFRHIKTFARIVGRGWKEGQKNDRYMHKRGFLREVKAGFEGKGNKPGRVTTEIRYDFKGCVELDGRKVVA
jgi:hypothetical protein